MSEQDILYVFDVVETVNQSWYCQFISIGNFIFLYVLSSFVFQILLHYYRLGWNTILMLPFSYFNTNVQVSVLNQITNSLPLHNMQKQYIKILCITKTQSTLNQLAGSACLRQPCRDLGNTVFFWAPEPHQNNASSCRIFHKSKTQSSET